jgi:hypothetical protein
MANTVIISCILDTTDPVAKLGFEAWVGGRKFVDLDHVQERQTISIEIPDEDGEHELRFVMKNKTSNHTKVDSDGNIVSDARLTITDLAFDEIQLGHIISKQSTYLHNFNGNGDTTQSQFYNELGCNGTVTLKFTTPVYLWLLEYV